MKDNRKLMVASTKKFNKHIYFEMSKELGITSSNTKDAFGNNKHNLISHFDRYTENKTNINK